MTGGLIFSKQESEQQRHIMEMLQRDAVNEALAYVKNLHKKKKITANFAEWIFADAKQWHQRGWQVARNAIQN